MNKIQKLLSLISTILLVVSFFSCINAQPEQTKEVKTVRKRSRNKQVVSFNYENEDLVNVINNIAGLRGVNIVLPQGANKIDAKLTWHLDYKISLKEAWNLLLSILNVAGYAVNPEGDFYRITKKSKDTSRLPTKIFIGTPPDQLPNADEPIKYVYYFANIKLSDSPEEEIAKVLTELLPPPASTFKIDTETNALIIMANAFDIKTVMQIVQRLDQVTSKEKMEIIRLHYSDPNVIANLFNENILKTNVNRYRLDTQKPSDAAYFSQHLKMFPIPRLNAVIVLGKESSIERVKNFIKEYLDIELGTGKSILHIYQLQYLDVDSFSKVLEKIVASTQPGAGAPTTGQAQAAGAEGPAVAGTERFFENVIISVDRPPEIQEQTRAEGTGLAAAAEPTPYYGGNKLIIAARNEDWLRIKKLIEELDTPQPQVYIEVLIADLTISDQRALSSIIRNPQKVPLPNDVNFQSAQTLQANNGALPNQFTPTAPPNPQPLTIGVIENPKANSDLLRFNAYDLATGQKSLNDGGDSSSLLFSPPGSTVFSLNDDSGSTWGILQVLKLFDRTKILSHPHVLAINNKSASIEISENRLVAGDATGTNNLQRRNVNIGAKLEVKLTPRISPANTVNLQVTIYIDEFVPGSTNARITRTVETNANINNGDILALGGLIKADATRARSGTPVLQDIPIIGWLFKGKASSETKTNLTVFISPTIIQPRLRQGASNLTQHYLDVAKMYATEGELFQTLRDPITRWFFKPDPSGKRLVDNFLAKDELKHDAHPKAYHGHVRTVGNTSDIIFDKKKNAEEIKELAKDAENPFSTAAVPTSAHLQS